jgi:hypothetical protein
MTVVHPWEEYSLRENIRFIELSLEMGPGTIVLSGHNSPKVTPLSLEVVISGREAPFSF